MKARRHYTPDRITALSDADLLAAATDLARRAHGERESAANLQRMSDSSATTAARLMREATRRGIA